MKTLLSAIILTVLTITYANAQRLITGKVSDKKGNPLPGVTVLEKGTKNKTMTLSDGTYSISVKLKSKYLIFSFIGMETAERRITGDTINIVMIPGKEDLEEVTITALGIKKSRVSSGTEIRSISKSDYAAAEYEGPAYGMIKGGTSGKSAKSGLLTAGEINDYGKWELWKDITENQLKTYKKIWNIMPEDRFCVQVSNFTDNPTVNAQIKLKTKDGTVIWSALTDNTGKAELWANMFGEKYKEDDLIITVTKNNREYKLFNPVKFHDGLNFINIPEKCEIPDKAEIAFVVDATGSMDDEISYLKAELEDVINKIKKQHKDISINTASVFYRDKNDNYLVKKSDFSENIKNTIEFIRKQNAGGGGDFPEAVDAGLNTAINELSWSKNSLAKVIFLILDAPPHNDEQSKKNIQSLSKKAAEKGIRIVPVTASGTDKSTEYLMRCIALATNGTYVFLTDDSGIGNSHIKPTTDEYQVELLNDVFIRLIKQYLTLPDCKGKIIPEEEIKDTTFITGNTPSKDSLTTNDTLTDIANTIIPEKIKYYPNPVKDILNIETQGKINEFFITDISGKILRRIDAANKSFFRINFSEYPAGIYFIMYPNGEKRQTGKIIHTIL